MSDQSKRFPFAILRPERIATAQKIFIKLHSTLHSAGKTKLTLFDTQTHRRKGVGKYAFFTTYTHMGYRGSVRFTVRKSRKAPYSEKIQVVEGPLVVYHSKALDN